MNRTPKDEPVAFDFDFDEAMQRIAQTNPDEVTAIAAADLSEETIDTLLRAFEDAARKTDEGNEFWTARDLAKLLGYADYRNFLTAVEKAKTACRAMRLDPDDHFVDVTDMIEIGKGGRREVDNIHLDRYACYLVAQNGDPRKRQISFAQNYFAIQTRRQELADEHGVDFDTLSENQKRLYLRNQVVAENKRLMSAARASGVVSGADFGKFNNKGYQGLYGGRGKAEIQQYKRLPSGANILDHMGSTELAANLFRITQTEEKLRSKNIVGKERACDAHYEVGLKVRQTMRELSGIMPEDLPVAEDVKKIARQERKQQRMRAIEPQQRIEQPLSEPKASAPVEIDLRADLWKYALLIMSVRPDGEISTAEMIAEMPNYVHLSEEHAATNASRKDSKFSQIVRNLKSHKNTKTNFIYRGYARDIQGGFKITRKGLDFVREYFKN
ncbi:MAG: DNA damage-inducible protein D [Altererythrobacter sp.]|nr:DNA damage-inducible protein D [Altererythrobacter sp.]OJU60546.1 MAG: DNA damage-inducible protein D [Altererythrobacter sp. 66-12]